jgi:hypothetical protein
MCEAQGVPCLGFEDFPDVTRALGLD